jgi:hypothetical protein
MGAILEAFRAREAWCSRQPPDVPLWKNGPTPDEFLAGLMRSTGSYITHADGSRLQAREELVAFFEALGDGVTIEPTAQHKVEGCIYLGAAIPPRWEGYFGAIVMKELGPEKRKKVHIVKGAHGVEPQLKEMPLPTGVVSVIADNDGIRTWHPGPVLGGPNPHDLTCRIAPSHDPLTRRYATLKEIPEELFPRIEVREEFVPVVHLTLPDNWTLFGNKDRDRDGPKLMDVTVKFVQ